MKKLRKFLIASVMTVSVISMSGLAALAPATANAAANGGDLIKMEGLSSVYYLGNDGKRYVFPNESTYFSWYSDFSGVVTIPSSELQSYPLGGNVTMRPGTTLVKITTDPSVYAVEPNGMLRKIQSESQAAALYGSNWNKRIVDLADSFFTNYTIGQALASGEVPVGSLVKNAGDASVYYYDGTNYRSIASEAAMHANRFSFDDIMVLSTPIVGGGNSITGMESDLTNTSQGATGPGAVVTGSGLMVSLNSQTPVSANIPNGVSVEFLKLNLTAASDGPVNVSGLTFKSYGLSTASNIEDVTVFDNGVKVGNSKDVNGSTREATLNFANPIYVAAGTTKVLTVKAKINVPEGSYVLGVEKASNIIASSASVTGSFPVQGNMMSVVKADGNISTLKVDNKGTSPSSAEFGEDNVLLADFIMEVDNEDLLLQSISLYNDGTRDDSIVSNLKLFIDGEEVASGVYANRYATFAMNNYLIEKGDKASVEVRGDIGTVSDSAPSINLYIKDINDIVAAGKTFGYSPVTNIDEFKATTNSIVVKLNAGEFTIDMDRAATPSQDVKPDTKDVILATIKMTSSGENATLSEIKALKIAVDAISTSTVSALSNITLKDLNTGSIYDLKLATPAPDYATKTSYDLSLSLDEDISFTKGKAKTFVLRADIADGVKENATFKVSLAGDSNVVVEGDLSEKDLEVTPSAGVQGSLITVKKASLDLNPTSLTNLNAVAGSSEVVYQARVKAGTADGVKIQSVKLTATTTISGGSFAFINDNIDELSLYLDGKLLKTVKNGISGTTISFNSLNSANYTVPAGKTVDLVVKAKFSSSLADGTFKLSVNNKNDVTARSFEGNDKVNVSTSNTTSRNVEVAKAGTLTVSLLSGSSKTNRDFYVLAGASSGNDAYLGELKFTTKNEAIKVKSFSLSVNGTTTDIIKSISAVKLVDKDNVVVASEEVELSGSDDAIVTFDPFNYTFDADKSTSLFIAVEAKGINDGSVTATAVNNTSIQFAEIATSTVDAIGVFSNEDTVVTAETSNAVSKSATVVGVKLNSVVNAMKDGLLTPGTKDLGEYTLVFDAGNNQDSGNEALKAKLTKVNITTKGEAITNPYLYVKGYKGDKATSTNGTFDANALKELVDNGEYNNTITLVFGGTVGTVADGKFIETSIADLAKGDITYSIIDNGVDTSIDNMLLPVTSVQGATLSR